MVDKYKIIFLIKPSGLNPNHGVRIQGLPERSILHY